MLSPPDADLARRDQALPGLPTLLDPAALIEVLRGFRPGLEAEGAAITYIRYKPRTSCLVGYKLRLYDQDLLVSVRARDPNAKDKLSKAEEKRGLPGPLGPGYLIIPDLALIVSVFPNDRRLPQLRRLADPVKQRSLLRKLGANNRAIRHGEFELLRYRPERRCVAQVVGDKGPAAVVKFHGKADYARARRNTVGFVSEGRLQVPAALASSDDYMAVASKWLKGEPATATPELALRVGEVLAELHAQRPAHLSRLTRRDQGRSLRSLALDFAALWPAHAGRCHAISERISAGLGEGHGHLRAIHGDFHIDQIVAHGDRIGFVDFDEAAHGPPAWDLGDFVGHLHRRSISCGSPSHDPEAIGEALYEGYRRGGGDVSAREIRLQTALALMRLAARPFRERDRDWPDVMSAILDRVETLLDALAPAPAAPADPTASLDRGLPLIEAALDPMEVQRQLDDLGVARGWRVTGARLVRHKPGRRCLIEYALTSAAGEQDEWLGKMRVRGADERAFGLQGHLWRTGFGPGASDGIMVAEPVALVPALGLWLQRKVRARPFGDLLAEGAECDPASAASALAKLHGAEVTATRRHEMADELRILTERLTGLAERRPFWADRIDALTASTHALAGCATAPRQRLIHRDFYPDHLLIHDNQFYIVDLDLFCVGDAAVDVGNFLAHLAELSLRATGIPDKWVGWQRDFESAYRRLVPDVSAINIRIYELLSLVRLVEISDRMPERRTFTEKLLELCEARFGSELADRRMGA